MKTEKDPRLETGGRGGRADEANDTAIVASPVTEIKNRLRRLARLERLMLDEACTCELGLCPSCVSLTSLRVERRELESTSEVVAR